MYWSCDNRPVNGTQHQFGFARVPGIHREDENDTRQVAILPMSKETDLTVIIASEGKLEHLLSSQRRSLKRFSRRKQLPKSCNWKDNKTIRCYEESSPTKKAPKASTATKKATIKKVIKQAAKAYRAAPAKVNYHSSNFYIRISTFQSYR